MKNKSPYLISFFLFLTLGVAAVMVTSILHIWFLKLGPDTSLLRYQIHKAENVESIDMVFVGDSSLGNAINAEEVTKLMGYKAVNLALTGYFGYAGSYNMMRRLLKNSSPKYVVIMHTANISTRDVPYRGYLMTTPDIGFEEFTFSKKIELWVTLGKMLVSPHAIKAFLKSSVKLFKTNGDNYLNNDYISQVAEADFNFSKSTYKIGKVINENSIFLREIKRLCNKYKIICMYSHGPLYEKLIPKMEGVLKDTNNMIEKIGLILLEPKPIALTLQTTGDAVDHVSPNMKNAITMQYVEKINSMISKLEHK